MVASSLKALKNQSSQFVKRLVEMLKVALSPSTFSRKALALVDRGLISEFIGIWPSPKTIATWIEKN
jgi:hypothetical protein